MKTKIFLLVLILLSVNVVLAEELTSTDYTVSKGDTFDLIINGDSNFNVLEFNLEYDPDVLSIVQIQEGSSVLSNTLMHNEITPGNEKFIYLSMSGADAITSSGEIVTISFRVVPVTNEGNTFVYLSGIVAANVVGTETIPVTLTATNPLSEITIGSSCSDECPVPVGLKECFDLGKNLTK